MLRLVRLAYRHVRSQDDKVHVGPYVAGPRDNAEWARGVLLTALLSKGGEEGWEAKIELARDPAFKEFSDRTQVIARETAAAEADAGVWKETQIVELDRLHELPPKNRDEMFAVLTDRIHDLEDLLLQDESPREAWAAHSDERVMRREIARELRNRSKDAYTVTQEAATAEEKETDIRLQSTGSQQVGVIELKVGDKQRTGRELREGIFTQLVDKYLAPEDRRAGCFLVTLAKDKTWQHPDDDGRTLDFQQLIAMLNAECEQVMQQLGGSVRVFAAGLDLRPRLETEKVATGKRSGRGGKAK